MKSVKLTLFCVALLLVQSAVAQKELAPEPGALAELDRYDLKLREAFSEAYERGVELRAICLPSNWLEVVIFADEKGKLVTLSPKKTSIWSHEYRELVREGTVGRTDADHREIPPYEENERVRSIPEKVSDIEIVRRSRRLPAPLLQAVREVWEDALIHVTHEADADRGLDGTRWHYSAFILNKGILSGTTYSPNVDTIPRALNAVSSTLIDYVTYEANETHVAAALWEYKVATEVRGKDVVKISIEKPPIVIPNPISVRFTSRIILEEFSVDDVSLEDALLQLTKKSVKWSKPLNYEDIIFSTDDDLGKKMVTHNSENESLKSICEDLAEQVDADLEFKESEVLLVKKSD